MHVASECFHHFLVSWHWTLCEAICESLSSPALSGPRPFPFPLRLAFIETAPCWHPIFLVDKSVALETHPLYRFGRRLELGEHWNALVISCLCCFWFSNSQVWNGFNSCPSLPSSTWHRTKSPSPLRGSALRRTFLAELGISLTWPTWPTWPRSIFHPWWSMILRTCSLLFFYHLL